MSVLVALTAVVALQAAEVDPNLLPIGRRGTMAVWPESLTDLRSGKPSSVDEIVRAAKGKRFVFLGENHATTAHQRMHADIIRALSDAGRNVVVGLEMYSRPKQDVLDQWVAGQLEVEDFLLLSDWKGQWGFPFDYYRPIFAVAKEKKLPMVALNVPRDWVRIVGQGGYDALPMSAKMQLPVSIDFGVKDHRRVFDALMGGHPVSGANADKMYQAQVLWDEGMADTAIKYLERIPDDSRTVFVVIAGSGHVLYDQGINLRVERRDGGDGITVVMMQSDEPVKVSRGIADFLFVSRKPSE